MKYELPELTYDYDSLAPYIDENTMRIHHDKHFQAYTNNFNKALENVKGLENYTAEEIIADVNALIPEQYRTAVINNGGGYINHKLFFEVIGPENNQIKCEIKDAIENDFGSISGFKEQFELDAKTLFGSGWVFLVVGKNGNLKIVKKANQDSPLTNGDVPILALDVWEHAYYLNYQNKRAEYISNFWKVINWDQVGKKYLKAL